MSWSKQNNVPIDRSMFLSKASIDDFINLRFNPGSGVAYFKSAEKGFSLLICQPKSGEEVKAAQLQEKAEEDLAANRTLLDALNLWASDPRAPANDYESLKLVIGTYTALAACILGTMASLYKKSLKVWKVLDSDVVQEQRMHFMPLLCREIQWAFITDGREYFADHLTLDDFNGDRPEFPTSNIDAIINNVKYQITLGRGDLPEKWKSQQQKAGAPPTSNEKPSIRIPLPPKND